jgi:hypothetical protein
MRVISKRLFQIMSAATGLHDSEDLGNEAASFTKVSKCLTMSASLSLDRLTDFSRPKSAKSKNQKLQVS